jgi:hypothetical protein
MPASGDFHLRQRIANVSAWSALKDTMACNDPKENHVQKFFFAVILSCLLATGLAAQGEELSKPKKYEHTPYLTGGVTETDSLAIRKRGPDYGLQLFFSVDHKPIAAGEVKVKILNQAQETIIDAVADGPLFFVKVDGGRYTVILDRGGDVKEKTFDLIGRRFGQFSFEWEAKAN